MHVSYRDGRPEILRCVLSCTWRRGFAVSLNGLGGETAQAVSNAFPADDCLVSGLFAH